MTTRIDVDHRVRPRAASTGPEAVPRHPEKAHRPDNPIQRKPAWIRVKAPTHPVYHETRALMRDSKLVTVCEEAACPNIGECWSQRHATMMIMGDTCTRACGFCNVATGLPRALDADEPRRVGEAVATLGLRHVVITSVDRDDLADGGAAHFARTIRAIRAATPETTIEVLTPDFLRKDGALEVVVEARPDVFNHNLETVPRLYPGIRPGARYYQSLRLLDRAKQRDPSLFTKSGLMVGLGEQRIEVLQVMDDLRAAEVDFLTIGQYLQPSVKHAAVDRFVTPEEFEDYARLARSKGFLLVSATPLTRSSYHADRDFAALKASREARQGTVPRTSHHALPRASHDAPPRASHDAPPRASRDTPPRDSEEVLPRAAHDVSPRAAQDVSPCAAQDVSPRAAQDVSPRAAHDAA